MKLPILILKNLLIFKYKPVPKDRYSLEKWQSHKMEKFLLKVSKGSSYYQNLLNKYSFKNFPKINKSIMMEHFDDINTVNIKKTDAFKIALEAEDTRDFTPMINEITIGLSSGTSGNRGIFLVSEEERSKWTAYIIKKFLLPIKPRRRKIAFFLRANSNLYTSIKSLLFDFKFFDLKTDLTKNLNDLEEYNPNIIAGPASMLRIIAEAHDDDKITVSPEKIVSGAEVLEETDKIFIEKIFKQKVHQVYQCTEGFLASTCKNGTLHFHEDSMIIEKEYIDDEKTKFYPIISDFTRTTQPIIKYKLNDIIVEKKYPCSCGSNYLAIDHIEGREDDIFYFKDNDSELKPIFPDYLRRAVITSSDDIHEYIVEQINFNKIKIYIKPKKNDDYERLIKLVEISFEKFFKNFSLENIFIEFSQNFPEISDKKLQRVKRCFKLKKSDE